MKHLLCLHYYKNNYDPTSVYYSLTNLHKVQASQNFHSCFWFCQTIFEMSWLEKYKLNMLKWNLQETWGCHARPLCAQGNPETWQSFTGWTYKPAAFCLWKIKRTFFKADRPKWLDSEWGDPHFILFDFITHNVESCLQCMVLRTSS